MQIAIIEFAHITRHIILTQNNINRSMIIIYNYFLLIMIMWIYSSWCNNTRVWGIVRIHLTYLWILRLSGIKFEYGVLYIYFFFLFNFIDICSFLTAMTVNFCYSNQTKYVIFIQDGLIKKMYKYITYWRM